MKKTTCEACLINEAPIVEGEPYMRYIVHVEENDDYNKQYSLCKDCYYKIQNILCEGSRREFSKKNY